MGLGLSRLTRLVRLGMVTLEKAAQFASHGQVTCTLRVLQLVLSSRQTRRSLRYLGFSQILFEFVGALRAVGLVVVARGRKGR